MFCRNKKARLCCVDEILVKLLRHFFRIRETKNVYKYAGANTIIHSSNPNLLVSVDIILTGVLWIVEGGFGLRKRWWGIEFKEDPHFLDNISVKLALYMTRKCSYGPRNVNLETRVIVSVRDFDSWSQSGSHYSHYVVRSFWCTVFIELWPSQCKNKYLRHTLSGVICKSKGLIFVKCTNNQQIYFNFMTYFYL